MDENATTGWQVDGGEPSTDEAMVYAEAERRKKRRGEWFGRGLLIFVVVGVLWVIVASMLNAGDGNYEGGDELGIYEAQAGCQEFVERRLKAPSTADFSSWLAIRTPGTASGWVVTGAVDSENSFGATLRSTFACRMHVSGDSWILDSMDGLT